MALVTKIVSQCARPGVLIVARHLGEMLLQENRPAEARAAFEAALARAPGRRLSLAALAGAGIHNSGKADVGSEAHNP